MNSIKTIFLLVCLSLTLIPSCKKDNWEGQIYVDQGVTIIENNGPGLWDKQSREKVEFIEELTLGVEDGEDHLMFYRLRSTAVDSELNLYVLDGGNHRLLKFNRDGQLLWNTGRQGQGPGEFEYPGKVFITPTEDLAVEDGRSIHFFDKKGKYQRSIKIGKSFSDVTFLPDGRLFINLFLRGQPGLAVEYYSIEGELLETFPVEYRYGPEMGSNMRASIGGGIFQWIDGEIYLSLPDRYEIRKYDISGNLLKKTQRDIKFKPPNIKVMSGGMGVSVRPSDSSGPCFFYQKEFLINCRYKVEKISEIEYFIEQFLDFFNQKDQFLGSVKLPQDYSLGTIDSEGKFYFIQRDPFPRIIRSRLIFNE